LRRLPGRRRRLDPQNGADISAQAVPKNLCRGLTVILFHFDRNPAGYGLFELEDEA
jgi:hypothetical protein